MQNIGEFSALGTFNFKRPAFLPNGEIEIIHMQILISLFSVGILICYSGHEVVHNFKPRRDDLKPNDLVIVQFDNRALANHWNVSAHWNYAFALKHGHQYAFLTMKQPCIYGTLDLSPVWCKVKAMVEANKVIPNAKAYLYLDSDAVITSNYSLTDVIGFMRKDLKWDFRKQLVAFNQDGPGWSCKHTLSLGFEVSTDLMFDPLFVFVLKNHSVQLCLNSGTVFWIKSHKSLRILESWWNAAGDPYSSNRFPSKWRTHWPWEQAQMYKIYEQYRNEIMILSFPDLPFLPWTSKKNPKSQYPTGNATSGVFCVQFALFCTLVTQDFVEPWCFSHWPGANCFITHWCSSKNQKIKLTREFEVYNTSIVVKPIFID